MRDLIMRRALLAAAAYASATLVSAGSALADCPPSCPITGGGSELTDCLAELASPAMHLNFPAFNPAKPKPGKEHRCFDGDPGCDLDGEVNGECEFSVDVCFRNDDPELASCTAADVVEFEVKGASKFPSLASLQTAANALLPATTNVCTTGNSVVLPLKQTGSGAYKRSKFSYKAITRSATATDKDKAKLSCIPHRWPSHGFDYKNTRHNSFETAVTSSSVLSMQLKWRFTPDGPVASRGVSSTPTVGRKLVYVTSWDGFVYAVDKKSGREKWKFDTGSGALGLAFPGVQASATISADGRVLVADGNAQLYCLDGKNGKLLWQSNLGDPDTEAAHAWASPRIANNRVIIGRASHSDNPCTQGRVYAFDLDTGAELWQTDTVPDGICSQDTTVECTTNADCGAGNECVAGVGGGITATAATSSDGETVYVATIGCARAPAVGNSDAVLALSAETGEILWTFRPRAGEQFTGATLYRDYGFVNGPILMSVDDGLGGTQELVVAGSKDGSLYAVDAATGAAAWSNEIMTPTSFVAFGLFNGAMGTDGTRIFATLYDFELNAQPDNLDRLWAFDATDGTGMWSDREDAYTWADIAVANGLVFVGDATAAPGIPEFHVYDAVTGVQVRAFNSTEIAEPSSGGATIVDGVLYVPFGTFGNGGVAAIGPPN